MAKKFNGYIAFRFDLSDELEKAIYTDLFNKIKSRSDHRIIELFKKYYFVDSSEKDLDDLLKDRIAEFKENEKKLLKIIDNLSRNNSHVHVNTNPNINNNTQTESTEDSDNDVMNMQELNANDVNIDFDNFPVDNKEDNLDIDEKLLEQFKNSIK